MVVLTRKKRIKISLEYDKATPLNPEYGNRTSVVGRFEITRLREEMGRFEVWCDIRIPLVERTETLYLNFPIGYIRDEDHLWFTLRNRARKKARSMLY